MGTFSFKNGIYEYVCRVYEALLSIPGVSFCGLTIFPLFTILHTLGHCSIFLPRLYVIPSC